MKAKSILLKEIPKDVYDKLIKIQGEEQIKNGRRVSLHELVYRAIRQCDSKRGD